MADKIHQEGVQTRAEISQDVKNEGKLTREAIQQTMNTAGELLNLLHGHIYNAVNVMC